MGSWQYANSSVCLISERGLKLIFLKNTYHLTIEGKEKARFKSFLLCALCAYSAHSAVKNKHPFYMLKERG